MLLKPSSFILFCLLVYSFPSLAQKGKKPQLEISGSLDFALSDGEPLGGFGSQLKLLWPVGEKNNAIVATLGFDRLYEDIEYDAYSYTFLLTSIGYRKGIQSFFIEPKLGFGICRESNHSDFCGFIGIEPGFQKRKFSYSIDYRFISSDGLVYGDHFHSFAFKVGYKIFSGR